MLVRVLDIGPCYLKNGLSSVVSSLSFQFIFCPELLRNWVTFRNVKLSHTHILPLFISVWFSLDVLIIDSNYLESISECASQLSDMEDSWIQLIQNCFISQLTRMGNPHNVPLFSMDFKSNSSQTLVMISLERILLYYPKDGQFKLS